MKNKKSRTMVWLATCGLVLAGCYTLTSVTTLMWNSPEWTGSGRFGGSGVHRVVGLAGQDVHHFGSGAISEAPLLSKFGGPYVLTSAAQTSSLGHHEHSFAHGNLVGRRDNLRLLYTVLSEFETMDWVSPVDPHFWEHGTNWDVVEICDMVASEAHDFIQPVSQESHLYISIRACPRTGGSCAGGIAEVQMSPDSSSWWIRSNQEGWQGTVSKANNTLFSDECMPISVTSEHGDNTTRYLVVGDPSWDELTVFDADKLWDTPLHSSRTPTNRRIKDVVIEGRKDGSTQFGFLTVLWTGGTGSQLQHTVLTNGQFPDDPHLTENVAGDTSFIETLGYGAETDSGELFSFADRTQRRLYGL
ncbi:MAG: hypothetical protein JKY56_02310 [Kofleriaceae bacterium]|nr:hypothetical protein [Kofleriaceae bacterium]